MSGVVVIIDPPKKHIQSVIDNFSNGKRKESIVEIESLIIDYPLSPLLLNVCATFYKSDGQLDIAVTKYKQALVLNSNYAEVHYNLGVTFRKLNKIEESLKSYKNAISIKNEYPDAHYNLGNTLFSLKQYDGAIKHYLLAIAFNPSFVEAYNNLGRLYKKIGKNKEAGENFDKALIIKPNYAEAAFFRGVIFQNDGDLKNAIFFFQKSLEINPKLVDAFNSIGLCEKALNETDKAIKAFEDAILINPNYASAYYNLSRFKNYIFKAKQILKMKLLLNVDVTSLSDLILINFTLANVNDNLGNKNDFFKYLDEANRLRKEKLNYSFSSSQKLFSNIYEIFDNTPNPIKESLRVDKVTKQPIFILGMPRSGTTLVEQIISSHKSVYGAGELSTLSKLLHPILNDKDMLSEKNLIKIREKYLESLADFNSYASSITDKETSNFQNIGFIFSMFPNAKIVHLKRDPRAICWSIYKSNWSGTGYGYSYNIDDLVKFYGLYSELMEFWHNKFPGKIYDICYEDLTTNQEKETKRLLDYCELEWDVNCLNFHKNKRTIKTASSSQVREKMYQGSSDNWRKYETHIQPLIYGLKSYLN